MKREHTMTNDNGKYSGMSREYLSYLVSRLGEISPESIVPQTFTEITALIIGNPLAYRGITSDFIEVLNYAVGHPAHRVKVLKHIGDLGKIGATTRRVHGLRDGTQISHGEHASHARRRMRLEGQIQDLLDEHATLIGQSEARQED